MYSITVVICKVCAADGHILPINAFLGQAVGREGKHIVRTTQTWVCFPALPAVCTWATHYTSLC